MIENEKLVTQLQSNYRQLNILRNYINQLSSTSEVKKYIELSNKFAELLNNTRQLEAMQYEEKSKSR